MILDSEVTPCNLEIDFFYLFARSPHFPPSRSSRRPSCNDFSYETRIRVDGACRAANGSAEYRPGFSIASFNVCAFMETFDKTYQRVLFYNIFNT